MRIIYFCFNIFLFLELSNYNEVNNSLITNLKLKGFGIKEWKKIRKCYFCFNFLNLVNLLINVKNRLIIQKLPHKI
jgi:hypothetical protein